MSACRGAIAGLLFLGLAGCEDRPPTIASYEIVGTTWELTGFAVGTDTAGTPFAIAEFWWPEDLEGSNLDAAMGMACERVLDAPPPLDRPVDVQPEVMNLRVGEKFSFLIFNQSRGRTLRFRVDNYGCLRIR